MAETVVCGIERDELERIVQFFQDQIAAKEEFIRLYPNHTFLCDYARAYIEWALAEIVRLQAKLAVKA